MGVSNVFERSQSKMCEFSITEDSKGNSKSRKTAMQPTHLLYFIQLPSLNPKQFQLENKLGLSKKTKTSPMYQMRISWAMIKLMNTVAGLCSGIEFNIYKAEYT